MVNDFRPFGSSMAKLSTSSKVIEREDGTEVTLPIVVDKRRRIDTSYEVYLALYQAITGPEERDKIYRELSRNFFDLIVVDECHRGSAAEDSAWREILDYFSGATQIGMTATPKETKYVSNIHYFGKPVYTMEGGGSQAGSVRRTGTGGTAARSPGERGGSEPRSVRSDLPCGVRSTCPHTAGACRQRAQAGCVHEVRAAGTGRAGSAPAEVSGRGRDRSRRSADPPDRAVRRNGHAAAVDPAVREPPGYVLPSIFISISTNAAGLRPGPRHSDASSHTQMKPAFSSCSTVSWATTIAAS